MTKDDQISIALGDTRSHVVGQFFVVGVSFSFKHLILSDKVRCQIMTHLDHSDLVIKTK